jgi:hypothetical protein
MTDETLTTDRMQPDAAKLEEVRRERYANFGPRADRTAPALEPMPADPDGDRDSLSPLDIASEADLFAAKLVAEPLYVAELGKSVLLRYMDGFEVDRYRKWITTGKGANMSVNIQGMRAKLAVFAIAKPDGSRMFADADVHRIMNWPSIILERITDKARKMNGLTEDVDANDEDAAGN